jgi:hypothetical protein
MSGGRRWGLPLLLVLCIARLWLMPLPSSFWLDETATIFVARHGSADPSLAIAAPQAWHSWYYPLIRWEGAAFGYSEMATRLVSILALLAFLALLSRLTVRLIHPEAAWFAIFACLALPGINYQAANARPYALGMLAFTAALLLLIRWLDSGGWPAALLFAGAAALVLYIHLLFWPSCLVFPLYAAARLARRETAASWPRAVLVFSFWLVLVTPVLLETFGLLREAGAHVIAPLPSAVQLIRSLELTLLAACAGGAWLIARARRRPADLARPALPALVLIGAWWLCQPVLLFAFSWLTGNAVFVPRYLQLALPGAALAATAAAAPFIPSVRWRPFAALLGLGALLFGGQWRTLWPRHHNSDWRAGARAVNRIEAGGPVPVICPSPFIEARPPAWRPGYTLPGFLYTHLDVYPIHVNPYLLPFEAVPEAESFAASLARGALSSSRRFLIYGWQPQVNFWRDWFARRPEFAAWHQRRLGPFADVDVIEFEH